MPVGTCAFIINHFFVPLYIRKVIFSTLFQHTVTNVSHDFYVVYDTNNLDIINKQCHLC